MKARSTWVLILCMTVCTVMSDPGESLPLRQIARGAFGGIHEPLQVAITNQTQWAELWKKHTSHQPSAEEAPKINFDKETILFVSAGRKNTGGHRIEVVSAGKQDDKVIAQVKATAPPPGAISLQALTAPFHIAAIPVTGCQVRFTAAPQTPPQQE